MATQQRRIDDPYDPWSPRGSGGGHGTGGLLLGTVLGIGIGILAAPQPGTKTRKQLLKRLAALSEGASDTFEDVQSRSSKATSRAKKRLEQLREGAGEGLEDLEDRWEHAKHRLLDEEEDRSPLGTVLAIAAGVAAVYVLTSDRAEPVRTRVQHVASDVKRRATDEWDRFQRGGFRAGRSGPRSQEGRSETRAGPSPSSEAPEAS
jgi:gas vesicle protein